jgi:hypothetical protein
MTTTPRLGAPELVSSQATPETTVNEQIRYVEQGASYFIVKDKDLTAAPGSPSDGDAYIVAAGATGTWSGKDGKIAFRMSTGWLYITPIEGMLAYAQDENARYVFNGSAWATDATGSAPTPTESLIIACSDETTALTTGTGKVTFRMPYAFTLSAVRASLTAAQASGSIFTVDINEGGTSILSTKLTIDNTEKTSTTAATAAVISDTSLADDAEMTIDIDQVGDGTAKGLKVVLIGTRT